MYNDVSFDASTSLINLWTLAQCKKALLDMGPNLEPVKGFSPFSLRVNLADNNERLRGAIRSLLADLGHDPEETFFPSNGICRTMVLTMHPTNLQHPVRLRSYTSRSDPTPERCTIWQAILATMATPTRYVAEWFGNPSSPHISASIGYGNPTKEAFDEAVRVWHLSAVGCIISIGAGCRSPIRMDKEIRNTFWNFFEMIRFISVLTEVATDTDRIHHDLSRDAKIFGLKYFRFCVREGVTDIAMQDWHRSTEVLTATSAYFEQYGVSEHLSMCASYMQDS
jgi:hypothetical protein